VKLQVQVGWQIYGGRNFPIEHNRAQENNNNNNGGNGGSSPRESILIITKQVRHRECDGDFQQARCTRVKSPPRESFEESNPLRGTGAFLFFLHSVHYREFTVVDLWSFVTPCHAARARICLFIPPLPFRQGSRHVVLAHVAWHRDGSVPIY